MISVLNTSFHKNQGRISILDDGNLPSVWVDVTKKICSEQHCETSESEKHISLHINESQSWRMVIYRERDYLLSL